MKRTGLVLCLLTFCLLAFSGCSTQKDLAKAETAVSEFHDQLRFEECHFAGQIRQSARRNPSQTRDGSKLQPRIFFCQLRNLRKNGAS